MKTKKRVINLCLTLLLIIAVVVLSFFPKALSWKKHLPVSIVKSEPETPNQLESYLVDYYVKNGKMVMSCRIKLKNTSNEEIRVRLYGYSWIDFVSGSLKAPELFALDHNGESWIFTIPAKSSVPFTFSFTGDVSERDPIRKWDRSLPDITIEIVGK